MTRHAGERPITWHNGNRTAQVIRRFIAITAVGLALCLHTGGDAAGNASKERLMSATATAIPESVRAEHHSIHAQLEEAMKSSGQVGAAARTLGKVLHPHFVREEEIALPPLGALAPLAAGTLPADAESLLRMTDALKRELPQMLSEHTHIRAAVAALRTAARADGATTVEQLADQLALHARTEEDVLYPAAVLVGELIRARVANK